jgi:hypothetical protein
MISLESAKIRGVDIERLTMQVSIGACRPAGTVPEPTQSIHSE